MLLQYYWNNLCCMRTFPSYKSNRVTFWHNARASNGYLRHILRNTIRGLAWRRGRSEQDRNQEVRDFHWRRCRQHAKTRRPWCGRLIFLEILSREGLWEPPGIMAVVGASKDQFVRVIILGGNATRAFAFEGKKPPVAALNIDIIERWTMLKRRLFHDDEPIYKGRIARARFH